MKSKPSNMKYTDLCIYIDNHLYYRDENNNPIAFKELTSEEIDNIYTYLYYIIIALSIKKRLMSNASDYEEFAFEAAGKIFGRVVKKDQDFTYKSRNNKPVKSILNYIKGCLGFLAISFREEHYNEVIKPERDLETSLGIKEYLDQSVIDQYREDLVIGVEDTLNELPYIVNKSLNQTIYKKKKKDLNDLKLSFYISMLNLLTLENKYIDVSDNKKEKRLLNQLENRDNYICTWNDNSFITKPVVQLQIKKILFDLQKEIDEVEASSTPSEDLIEAIISSALPTYGVNQLEEE